MRLLTNKGSAEWARRVIQDISRHANNSCPAHCTTLTSADANFDHSKADYAFEVATTTVRYGSGLVDRELHHDVLSLGREVKRDALKVAVFTDALLAKLEPVKMVLRNLDRNNIKYEFYDRVTVEPTNKSVIAATDFLAQSGCQVVIAVGGGSVLDTAKGANLLTSPGVDSSHLMNYVNAPVGKGQPMENEQLKPLIAIPTTTGTGSETTGTVVFDIPELRAKSGISNRKLRPSLALLEPSNAITQPTSVFTYSGFDVLWFVTFFCFGLYLFPYLFHKIVMLWNHSLLFHMMNENQDL